MDFAYFEVQWVLQKRAFSVKMEGRKGPNSSFGTHTTLEIMLPTEGGEHIFKQLIKIAGGIDKLPCVMCIVVFVGGLLGAKNAQVMDESNNFKGPLEQKKNEPSEPRSERNEQSDEHGSFSCFSGVGKVVV